MLSFSDIFWLLLEVTSRLWDILFWKFLVLFNSYAGALMFLKNTPYDIWLVTWVSVILGFSSVISMVLGALMRHIIRKSVFNDKKYPHATGILLHLIPWGSFFYNMYLGYSRNFIVALLLSVCYSYAAFGMILLSHFFVQFIVYDIM